MGGKRKAPRPAPEGWTGRRIRAGLDVGGGGPYIGILEEANDRGIVLRREVEDGELTMFFPWRVVLWTMLLDESQSESQS
jgi:hypothetical protein